VGGKENERRVVTASYTAETRQPKAVVGDGLVIDGCHYALENDCTSPAAIET